eukprot:CAMPEP_0113528308 /NCGR_PEP_ID=MMETSP0015_2-20120614/1772_1 /TAXON_ID=2838 /ORGANISM="Odontella" /LENGTH=326 /DNA_ID=CAMNT_0000426825 /DNA_START=83 /DNA_END=1063 /DNA_ORIENTATION=+ /assembly_acc=CAM_ASM_000160
MCSKVSLIAGILCGQVVVSCAFGYGVGMQVRRSPFFVASSTRYRPVTTKGSTTAADVDTDSGADTLTTKELAERLRLVRGRTRSEFKNATSPEAIAAQLELCDQLYSTRFRNLAISRTEARPSEIHGTGLFATRPIDANELITLYPGDALLAWGDEYGGRPGPAGCPLQARYGPHVSDLEQTSPEFFLLRPEARDFEVFVGRRRSIVGDPARNSDPAYLGQLANDAACLRPGEDVKVYEESSAAGENAAHLSIEGCHFATVATRPIGVGEEILVSYGEGYWLSRAGVSAIDRSSKTSGKEVVKGKSDGSKKKTKKTKQPKRGFGKS